MKTILAVDDERSVCEAYRMTLGDQYRLLLANSAPAALELLETTYTDLILLDLTMPGMSGLEFLQTLEEQGETTPVIVVTGSNSVENAVRVMKHDVADFVIKPFDVAELIALVERTLGHTQREREREALREQGIAGFEHIVGESPALLAALDKARQAMSVDSTVLITGETGTGKDVLARAIHFGGPRNERPYVPLSCCNIPASLVESELFGHVKGAFTGATESRPGKMQVADGGTLFLDELGEMPMEAQAKLLRVLQDGAFFPVGGAREISVDVRFICATNRDFGQAIAEGRFREDLYYRVNVLPVEMPPLRKRRDDIPRLVAHFMSKHGPRVNSKVAEFSPRAMARLLAYHWPGNVRELENTVERVLVCHRETRVIQPNMLDGLVPDTRGDSRAEHMRYEDFEGLPLQDATNRLERYLINRALRRCNFVQSQAAEMLGTTRRILKYKMDQLDIQVPDAPDSMAS